MFNIKEMYTQYLARVLRSIMRIVFSLYAHAQSILLTHTLKLDVVFQPMLNTIFRCVIRLS